MTERQNKQNPGLEHNVTIARTGDRDALEAVILAVQNDALAWHCIFSGIPRMLRMPHRKSSFGSSPDSVISVAIVDFALGFTGLPVTACSLCVNNSITGQP